MGSAEWILVYAFLCLCCYVIGRAIGEVLRERAEEAERDDP